MIDIKKFLQVLKNYLNYVMKASFKDLLIYFLELMILVVISLLLLFPIEVIRSFLYQLILLFSNPQATFYQIYNIIMYLVGAFVSFCFFIYMFNKRYEDIEKIRSKSEDRVSRVYKNTENEDGTVRRQVIEEELDLPKKAEKKRF